ncbi:MAG: uL30 family ribosomal protein [Candidatus Woesearchaeota archaeon]|nr:uL30 family ribosomal protein [Candidatus Woesearchaeota archaeon]
MTKDASSKVVVVRIRGDVNLNGQIRSTLDMLRLRKKHVCVIYNDSQVLRGMLRKVKDYVTWGIPDAETETLLRTKRASKHENVFFLAPPRKGHGRKGIKRSFVVGGALGERREKINELLQRMI